MKAESTPLIQPTRVLLFGIWRHLTRRRRIQLGLLLVVMLVSGAAELLSLGSVLPFLAVLSDPQHLWQKPWVQIFASRIGFTQANDLLLPASLLFASAAVLAALVRLANLWINGRLAAAIGSDLSCEAYQRTLYQPYGVHVQRNSAAVITATTIQIDRTVAALTVFLQLMTALVVAVGLLTGLLLINWVVALSAALLFLTTYSILAITVRKELHVNSQRISVAVKQQIQALQEGLGSIRDVLLDGNQKTYVEIYRLADRPQRQLQAKNQYLVLFPRYAVEALGLVAIALLAWLLIRQQSSDAGVIQFHGELAHGAQLLIPPLQQV